MAKGRHPGAPGRRPKRTRAQYDAQRSAATRQKILDAAFAVLIDRGYAATTTVEVGRRAGVARGTLLHHFPDRETLMVAALEHVFERRLAEFEREAAALVAESAGAGFGPRELVDLLWRAIGGGQATVAWLELVVAGRTDPALRRALSRMMKGFDRRIEAAYVHWFPRESAGDPGEPWVAQRLAFALMNGLVVDRMAGLEGHIDSVIEALKRIAEDRDGG